jgi:hypothetical protein
MIGFGAGGNRKHSVGINTRPHPGPLLRGEGGGSPSRQPPHHSVSSSNVEESWAEGESVRSNPVKPSPTNFEQRVEVRRKGAVILSHAQLSGDGAGLTFPSPSPCPAPLGRGDRNWRARGFLAHQVSPLSAADDSYSAQGMLRSSRLLIKIADECFLVPAVKSRNLL